MSHSVLTGVVGIVMCLLAACRPVIVPPSSVTAVPGNADEPSSFPLSEPGPYSVARQSFAAEDVSRDGRLVNMRAWYPAVPSEDATGTRWRIGVDLPPNTSGAPYPLILSSTKVATILAPYLVSHG
ncbi:MAG: hypothetical protein MUQ10_14365, partial [Anaerolineae bacterium]|nr:hypothetical protein [Anaerolineae bacterium]